MTDAPSSPEAVSPEQDESVLARIAADLDAAQSSRAPTRQPSEQLSVADAYRVQHSLLGLRERRGEQVSGVKLGFTSAAKMAQMGVSEIILGRLTDAMRVLAGAEVELGDLIHPRIEPEVAFRLARDVDLDDPTAQVEASVDAVAPALEIIDSRYDDFRFNLSDVIADNTSAAGFVVGPWRDLRASGELGNRAVRLTCDGRDRATGSTAAILGHPLRVLEAMLVLARRHRVPLRAGQVILAGAATEAVPFGPGCFEVHVAGVGSVSVAGSR